MHHGKLRGQKAALGAGRGSWVQLQACKSRANGMGGMLDGTD